MLVDMALPGHSPQRPFMGSGSPPRPFVAGPSEAQFAPSFTSRQMLPPSPQHYQPRFPQQSAPLPPPPPPSASVAQSPYVIQNDPRTMLPGPKRPSSSMSISSMLGSDGDKGRQESMYSRSSTHLTMKSTPSMSLGAVMSPPQNPPRSAIIGEYPQMQRSQSPERMNSMASVVSRQHRSGSGSMIQRPPPFETSELLSNTSIPPPQQESFSNSRPLPAGYVLEAAERQRRTSLSGILQRSNSQPQSMLEPRAPRTYQDFLWPEASVANGNSAPQPDINGLSNGRAHYNGINGSGKDSRTTPGGSSYDTRPPAPPPKQMLYQTRNGHEAHSTINEGRTLQTTSPEPKRSLLAGMLNGPSVNSTTEPISMVRQDSAQSQGDRFIERLDWTRPRFRSPFANSYSQPPTVTSAPSDDAGRKGSDELSHHRAVIGLANESKRGRYSPLPQAVQGAQAQTPIPDTGIKSEHGRVFAGLGSGIRSESTGPTTNTSGLAASPFKRDDGLPRLSEDNLMKISRSSSGTINKRARKFKGEERQNASDPDARGPKRSKINHPQPPPPKQTDDVFAGRNTPLPPFGPLRRTSTPTIGPANQRQNRNLQNSHITQPHSTVSQPNVKPRPIIKISHILKSISSNPRRHLGSYVYSPTISTKDPDLSGELSPANLTTTTPTTLNPNPNRRQISIQPNPTPIFSDPHQVNCTYTIRISRLWLRAAEREAIRSQRRLWGTGIYTDDSDPLLAAMHAGFIRPSFRSDLVDLDQLAQISKLYDPVIDGGQENVPEDGPVEPPGDRDCHVTLLVVPRLEGYLGKGRSGIVSRRWGGGGGRRKRGVSSGGVGGSAGGDPFEEGGDGGEDEPHDGVSFMVLNVKFVDEGRLERGRGRSGAERKRLLKETESGR